MFSFGKPSKAKFAAQLRAAIIRAGEAREIIYDAENFRLIRRGGDGQVNLANLYREHCSLPRSERKAHLERLAKVFGGRSEELPTDFEEAKPHLRPKVWSRWFFVAQELQQRIGGGNELDVPRYPLGSHLYSSLVYDTEHAMRSISTEQLEKWSVSYYEALEIACQNLDESSVAFAKIGDNFLSSMSGDNYDSSRVLLLDRIQSFKLAGAPIAIVPHRDAMYVAGSEDEVAVKIMFDLVAEIDPEQIRPLCPLPMILEDGEWIDWVPPKDHPVRQQYEQLELHFLGGLYADQQNLLAQLFEGDEDAPFVASFSAAKKQDLVQSYCVWTPSVDALLPRTQLVMFPRENDQVTAGKWEQVAAVVGSLMVPDESHYPVRYRVREFPSEQQLAEIEATAS